MTSLNEYIAFLETLNEASIIYTDKVIWASPQYLQLGGYTSLDEVKNTSIYTHNHPDDLLDQQKNIAHRKATKEPTSGTWRIRRKDGTYFKIYSRGSVVTLNDEIYYVAIARNHEDIQNPRYTSSTMKHETLTPLTAARGYLEIIETRTTDPETLRLLQKTSQNLDQLDQTIQKYLQETQQQNKLTK